MKKTVATKWPENRDRFKELVLYLSQKCATDPHFNTLKLNKLLFFSDFLAYAILGEPITGFEYQKLERGPAPRKIGDIKGEMKRDGDLGFQDLPLTEWRKTVNLRSPNLGVFTAQQIALVDAITEAFEKVDGDVLSSVSHQMPCWTIPDLYEAIPYESVFLSEEEVTQVDIERGLVIAEARGLLAATA